MEKPAATGPVEVDDLDGTALRDAVAGNSTGALVMARDRYALAYQWCITHPPADADEVAVMGDAGLPGLRDNDTRVGGDGTPGVSAYAVTEYAALAGVSTGAGVQVLSDTLDLHHRLPSLWRRVEALRVPAWSAARVAQDTYRLSAEAAAWIDGRLAALDRYDWSTIDATVKQATAMFHPELLKSVGLAGREEWDVTVDHTDCADGTSRLEAIGDSLDLWKFHDLVCDEAAALKALGDTDGLGQRKAKALGVLADRQATLDLDSTEVAVAIAGVAGTDKTEPGTLPRRSYVKTQLYLHLSLTDLAASWEGDPARVGHAGRLGPQLVRQLEAWLAACGSDAKVTPVIDLNHDWSLDRHDPPEAMREQVILRDQHCVFPSCTVGARRADLDHITPYDPDGPPGQTHPDALAALCRRHHCLKTFTAWTYHREATPEPTGRGSDDTSGTDQVPAGPSYLWTSPHGEHWRVRPGHGTTRLTDRTADGRDPGRS